MAARTPEECDRLFGEHVNAGDVDALMTLYEPGCAMVQRDGTIATGHAAIRGVLDRLVAMRPIFRVRVVRVVPTGADLAMLYSDWTASAKGADGTPVERSGKAIEVVRRQPDGTWRIALDDPFARG
jgi:uncharacterized protein (TIGR02246 family)